MDSILSETKTTEREIYLQDDAIEVTKYHCENLEAEVRALYSENVKLKCDAETVQEEFEVTSARNNVYREKIKAHKHLFWEMESKMPIMIELAKKKAVVQELKTKKEELIRDLQNPEGSVIKQVQEEITLLKREITTLKEFINKKGDFLEEEKKMHAKLRKEIEPGYIDLRNYQLDLIWHFREGSRRAGCISTGVKTMQFVRCYVSGK
uniref:Coiled-coil domain containing 122 n=1 Tax=Falco tinnunculus TaxID=100819 RepID=A0A8C4U4H5_FALTI